MKWGTPLACCAALLGCQGITVVDPVIDTKSDESRGDEAEEAGPDEPDTLGGDSQAGSSGSDSDASDSAELGETGGEPSTGGEDPSTGGDPLVGDPLAGFVERSAELGVDAVHDDGQTTWLTTGQVWADFDRDGHLDLVLTSQLQPNLGLRGSASGSFSTPPWATSVALADRVSSGAVAADYDNDGYLDLYLLAWGPNSLLHNLAGLAFEDRSQVAGVADPGPGWTASFADYDGDGWLDLYVANNSFEQPDRLYHNRGEGSFADASALLDEGTRARLGLSASFFDYDRDGDPDLYVANDKQLGNVLWRNEGPGCGGWCFSDVSAASGAGVEMYAMGLALGDYDNDGDMDLFITDIGEAVLLQNQLAQGEAVFVDVAAEAGVLVDDEGWGEYSWGAQFLDFDNDGWLDLYVNIGKIGVGPSQPNCLLHNQGEGSFIKLDDAGGASDGRTSFGLALADFDDDGWSDLLVGNRGEAYALFHNQGGGHHYLNVELDGAGAPFNRDAIGTKLTLVDDQGRTQTRELIAGSSTGAGSSLVLSFGFGEALPVSAQIEWPDGTLRAFVDPPVDQTWRLSWL